ncbi:TPA: hypothetical protein JG819_004705 [Vibrio parahaemolyticus]|nr:hypothetical protein [Vibrio parahaemolyticus]HAV1545605.1 hypothetical protein [Vibrio parahaemolyticus]
MASLPDYSPEKHIVRIAGHRITQVGEDTQIKIENIRPKGKLKLGYGDKGVGSYAGLTGGRLTVGVIPGGSNSKKMNNIAVSGTMNFTASVTNIVTDEKHIFSGGLYIDTEALERMGEKPSDDVYVFEFAYVERSMGGED